MDAAPELTLGLRFPPSEAKPLRAIADELRRVRPEGIDISLFDKAAESAELDEPLLVHCTSRTEIEQMAHGFTRWGLDRPAIDDLNPRE